MDVNDFLPKDSSPDEPPMNAAIEDCLAMSGMDALSRKMTLAAWMNLGAEYLAREFGRAEARRIIASLDRFVADAKPAKDWPK